MAESANGLDCPITVVVKEVNHYRLGNSGWLRVQRLLFQADVNGMIDGTCKGAVVFMFSGSLKDGNCGRAYHKALAEK